MVKLNNEETKQLLFFQQATGAAARDCVFDNDSVVFVVAEGEIGAAVGKGGKNIGQMQRLLKKQVLMVEYSHELERFVENIFFPTKVQVSIQGDTIRLKVEDENDKKYVIGKGGQKIKLARILVGRHFGPKEIRI